MLRRMRGGSSILSVALLVAGFGTQALAKNKLSATCNWSDTAGSAEVHCDIRGSEEPAEFDEKKFEVKVENGGSVGVVGYDPFNFKIHKPAYLFLIQRTGHPRDASTEVEKLLRLEGPKRAAGLYSYADGLEEHAKLGSSESDIRKALTKVKLDKGVRTTLYAAVREASQRLGEFDADRKVLVVFSDGPRADDTYKKEEAVAEARKNNVVIYAILMTGASGASNLPDLRALAEETGGMLFDAGNSAPHALPPERISKFYDYFESGGLLKLKGSDVPDNASLVISANLSNTNLRLDSDPVTVGAGGTGSIWDTVVNWTKGNPIPAGALGVVVLGLLVVGYTMARRGRIPAPIAGVPTEADEDYLYTSKFGRSGDPTAALTSSDTVILTPMNDRGSPETVYAWLQFLDATSTRVPIGATNVRIGRHKDNDICLQNNSVHRQHAVLHMSHDRKFVIRDLGTTNGVVVNNQRVNQKELSDGDLIELGEVRARFFSNPAAAE